MIRNKIALNHIKDLLPNILFITSYPPRECGIATYSQDLTTALDKKFSSSFNIVICALESEDEKHDYAGEVEHILNVDSPTSFASLTKNINNDASIQIVMIQHEFGFFEKKKGEFVQFLSDVNKSVVIVFHTVLPHPNESLKESVQEMSALVESIIVMTNSSAGILTSDYMIPGEKITVIPHGTHLVPHLDKRFLKNKYKLTGRKVLSTFGLLSSGKSIETTLEALPDVVKTNPHIIFLIIGKTHPSVVKLEGEKYRKMLEAKVETLQLQAYVRFINYFLPLADLLEYLQLTDIYLFTSKDPNQAVSGTFSYAISCGCPVISTPIPHAREVLKNDAGIIFNFENPAQLSEAITGLLRNEELRKNIGSNGLYRMASTAWENSAIAHAMLFEKIWDDKVSLRYDIPAINLNYVKKLTTGFGIIQFSKLNHPDIGSGYTLDDNSRALIAMCLHLELTGDAKDIQYINIYFNVIKFCMQPGGNFLNYVSEERDFTEQNNDTNLEDSNGRAIWALGHLLSIRELLPVELIQDAESIMDNALLNIDRIHSTRAMGFVIKGLYYRNRKNKLIQDVRSIREFANRLVQMYKHENDNSWRWFESYLTYANSLLPEAMLCAWLVTGEPVYKEIARTSFDFLLSKIFLTDSIKVISNKGWLYKEESAPITVGGEQPIDVAYTILALKKFHDVFKDEDYKKKMTTAFNWFLGNNHLHQVIYNPCTGGCYDGLEENYVNLNQGAESTISYLLARLTVNTEQPNRIRGWQRSDVREGYLINNGKAISLRLA